jgi:outer membrane receptor protein involved in Fe transport
LLNLGAGWNASKGTALDVRLHHVGPRHREQTDARDKLASYTTVDVTAKLFNLGYRGLTVRGGIKNLFDREVKVPAVVDTSSTLTPQGANYRDDMPMSDGRGVWVQATYGF